VLCVRQRWDRDRDRQSDRHRPMVYAYRYGCGHTAKKREECSNG